MYCATHTVCSSSWFIAKQKYGPWCGEFTLSRRVVAIGLCRVVNLSRQGLLSLEFAVIPIGRTCFSRDRVKLSRFNTLVRTRGVLSVFLVKHTALLAYVKQPPGSMGLLVRAGKRRHRKRGTSPSWPAPMPLMLLYHGILWPPNTTTGCSTCGGCNTRSNIWTNLPHLGTINPATEAAEKGVCRMQGNDSILAV